MDNNKAIKTLLEAVRNLGNIARMINPEINHITCYSIDNAADFTAYAEAEGDDAVLSGHLFEDGSFKIGSDYYHADEKYNFTVEKGGVISERLAD